MFLLLVSLFSLFLHYTLDKSLNMLICPLLAIKFLPSLVYVPLLLHKTVFRFFFFFYLFVHGFFACFHFFNYMHRPLFRLFFVILFVRFFPFLFRTLFFLSLRYIHRYFVYVISLFHLFVLYVFRLYSNSFITLYHRWFGLFVLSLLRSFFRTFMFLFYLCLRSFLFRPSSLLSFLPSYIIGWYFKWGIQR